MSNNNNDDSWILLVIGAIVSAIAFVVWQFSTFFGLDISTGGAVFGRLVALVVVAGATWKFGEDFDPIQLGNTWPILLALLWCCWWPALDFWASQQRPSFFSPEEVSIWWAAWYTKWSVFAAILGVGYTGKKFLQPAY